MMIPNPTRLTKIVRKMMRSGRVTSVEHSIQSPEPIMRLDRSAFTVSIGAFRLHVIAVAVATTAVTLGAQTTTPGSPPRIETMKPEVLGTHGIVAAGRHYSVSAGVRILQQGGNAIDAGVATVFAAAVCEISHFGFGGEAP